MSVKETKLAEFGGQFLVIKAKHDAPALIEQSDEFVKNLENHGCKNVKVEVRHFIARRIFLV